MAKYSKDQNVGGFLALGAGLAAVGSFSLWMLGVLSPVEFAFCALIGVSVFFVAFYVRGKLDPDNFENDPDHWVNRIRDTFSTKHSNHH